ncbi:right-handed parallel beta-helix repeat-containing protein [Streptomyces sp. enrichment culture]|uniref:right-handed parallel beta-helix repeat-containing protein n=1 Tax=Streptomyces sp. enrichment culture TaxID=1795815 RepID=UPI003F57A647
MALPEGIPTVTVTGRYLSPDGRPLAGQVVFRAPALVTFADQDVIVGGPVTAPLDASGAFEVELPATDAPGMNPAGWSYSVAEQLVGVAANRVYNVLLPAESPTVDIADIAPTDPTTPTYVAVRGASAYEVAVARGFVGSETEWLASLVGPVGPAGSVDTVNGQAGPDVVLDAGDVNALPDTGVVAGGSLFLDSTGGPGYRGFNFRTDGLRRWVFQVDNGAETGGDAGSDFELSAWSDADTWKSVALYGKRSTGQLGIGTNTLAAGARATVGGPLALADGTAPPATAGHAVLYSAGGKAYVRQADGTSVPITPAAASPGIYNVATYGAVGDGTTNDAPAIQTALDAAYAAGGGTVVLPAGKTYAITTFLAVRARTTVWAYGATIKATGTTGLLRNFLSTETFAGYAGHSHIRIFGGTWDANASDGTTGTVTGMTNAINFVHCRDITVRDVTIKNVSSAHALEFNAVDGARALTCRFEGFRDNSGNGSRSFAEAVQIDIAVSGSSSIGQFDGTPSRDVLVEGCYFGPSDRCGPWGRAIGSHTTRASTYYDNIRIIGNRIDGALQEGIRGYAWRRVTIADNVITGTGMSGIEVGVPDPATAGYTLTPRTIAITGNVVEGNASEGGIRVEGVGAATLAAVSITGNTLRSSGSVGIHCDYAPHATITGNTVDTTSSTGILAQNSDYPTITGNTVRQAGSNAINASGSTGGTISGNTVDTTGSNFGIFVGPAGTVNSTALLITGNNITAAASAGIRLSTNATGCTVTGNKIRKGSGTTATGINLAASATGAVIVGNDLSGNGWAAATAVSVSTAAPKTDYAGGTAVPGHNLI